MKYLLDVNALIAWRHPPAHGHARFHAWARQQGWKNLTTCAQVELGFIRVSMLVFGLSLKEAQSALTDIKKHTGGFIDTAPSPKLAAWARTAGQTSDAYLSQLSADMGLKLATFDTGIPDAVLIE